MKTKIKLKLPVWQDSWRNLAEQTLKRPLSENDVQVLRDAYQTQANRAPLTPSTITGIICPLTAADGRLLEIRIQPLATDNYGWNDPNPTWEGVVDFSLVGEENNTHTTNHIKGAKK